MSILFALLLQVVIPDSSEHPQADAPYFTYALLIGLVIRAIIFGLSFIKKDVQKKLIFKGYFIAGAVLLLNMINLLTVKSALLPVLYFPSLDRIFGVLVTDSQLLADADCTSSWTDSFYGMDSFGTGMFSICGISKYIFNRSCGLVSNNNYDNEGELLLDGKKIAGTSHERGLVFQQATLFPWLNIYDNVAFDLKTRHIYKENKSVVQDYIKLVGLALLVKEEN